ncbi:class I SAM-dependent methyltransferase [Lysobacter claricitrinus]|uniref:class I SAM-dependent methyltransferase n=1 Tax=Lysobacter claricitrinus TaxID=3367728 RepID=UPI0037DBA8EA
MDSDAARHSGEAERRPHAVLDLASRGTKARKIERLLGLEGHGGRVRLLEIGCGSGGIADYFSRQSGYDVVAVDVLDQRQIRGGYEFRLLDDVDLPFPAASFDVVISNHVVEHVGDGHRQLAHLRELARVLRPDGTGYLAVPNRWALIEPHFRVPLLSWLPRSMRTPYLRLVKGTHYDCNPLGPLELDALLRQAGLASHPMEAAALQAMLDLDELPRWIAACVSWCPVAVRRAVQPMMPTLIRSLRPA